LAGEVIAAEDLAFGKFDYRSGAFNHPVEPDDRRHWVGCRDSVNNTTTVHDELGFVSENKPQGTASGTDIEGLKIGVEHQYRCC
jgi:hypothetical protein